MSGVGLALAAVSAVAKLKAGQAQAAQYQYAGSALLSQAKYTRFKGKQDSLKYKKQAVDELEKILARMAHTSAAAGAGNMDTSQRLMGTVLLLSGLEMHRLIYR